MNVTRESGPPQDYLTVTHFPPGGEQSICWALEKVGYRIAQRACDCVVGRRMTSQRHRGSPVLPAFDAPKVKIGDDPEPVGKPAPVVEPGNGEPTAQAKKKRVSKHAKKRSVRRDD